jgi:hypothetical protein
MVQVSDTPYDAVTEPGASTSRRRFGVRIGALLAVGLAGAFVTWIAIAREDDDPPPATSPVTTASATGTAPLLTLEPTLLSPGELRRLVAAKPTPVFWVGRRSGVQIEASGRTDGTFYVRYLPSGWQAGDGRATLTIATYPRANGFAEVRRSARDGATSFRLPGGGLAVHEAGAATNVHFAYPGQAYQVEVFAPRAGVARRLVASGAVRPLR